MTLHHPTLLAAARRGFEAFVLGFTVLIERLAIPLRRA
jgi:hypothetical protein